MFYDFIFFSVFVCLFVFAILLFLFFEILVFYNNAWQTYEQTLSCVVYVAHYDNERVFFALTSRLLSQSIVGKIPQRHSTILNTKESVFDSLSYSLSKVSTKCVKNVSCSVAKPRLQLFRGDNCGTGTKMQYVILK